MKRAVVDGITLEYEVSGTGEPVVFIHGALIADTFRPLMAEPSLERYRRITYHRRGYEGSTRSSVPVSVEQQAADCMGLLRHLGVQRSHIVGHSSGGCFALQLALDAPEAVHSMALLEPALMVGESGESYRQSLVRGAQRYREVGAAVVVDEFLEMRCPGYRAWLEDRLPGAFEQAVANVQTTFEMDIGLVGWHFGEVEAQRIIQPTLSVLGGESEAIWSRFGETHRTILDWFPHSEGLVLPGVTHFLQVENPRAMAEVLAAFFARHPLPA